jgi:hypothetical protein
VNFNEGVIGIGLAGEQRLGFLTGNLLAQRFQCVLRLSDNDGIAFRLAQFDQSGVVGERLLQPKHLLDAAIELLARAH